MRYALGLGLALLATVAGPGLAAARGGHGVSGHHHGGGPHRRVHHFVGVYAPFPYGYPCWTQEGGWIDQVYMDRYGHSTTVTRWVPGREVCWY
jgi:hypothetical protein